MVLEALFGKKKSPDQILREQKRLLDRAVRDLEREKNQLLTQERKYAADIKTQVQKGQTESAKVNNTVNMPPGLPPLNGKAVFPARAGFSLLR